VDQVRGALTSIGQAAARNAADLNAEQNRLRTQLANAVSAQVRQTLGSEAGRIADLAILPQRWQTAADTAALGYAEAVMRGRNPLAYDPLLASQATLLATAIIAARDELSSRAQPVPDEVKQWLRGLIPDAVLDRAKYVIGEPRLTQPDAVNGLQTTVLGHEGHAVTVDHIIVFSRKPDAAAAAPHVLAGEMAWWAHELRHVDQYREWGVAEFALRYLTESYAVEGDARSVESGVYAQVLQRAWARRASPVPYVVPFGW
jgi:hypothetical protein